MTPPLWLLDVDGVLNAVSTTPPRMPGGWKLWQVEVCNGYPITYSPDLIERISALVEGGAVEVRWLTTWWDDIAALPFSDWRSWPVACTAEDVNADGIWWKFAVALRHYGSGRKLVWTDDDLAGDARARAWAAERADVLAIAPRPELGLTPKQMTAIEAFLSD